MTVWVTPLDEEPQAAEVLAEGKWNSEWVVEKYSYKYQFRPCEQLEK